MTASRSLLGFDELAVQALAHANAFRFAVAESEAERAECLRLRARCVVEHGWAHTEDLPGGLESDEWDDAAVHLAAWDGNDLAGTARLVFPARGRRLPTEEAFGIVAEPVGQVVDVGRLVVAPRRRGDPLHRILAGLWAIAWQQTRRRGFHVYVGAASERIIAMWRSLGFEVTILGPAREHLGEERYPARATGQVAGGAAWLQSE